MRRRQPVRKDQGVALVVTVIVVAMLAVVAVALMQSTTVDRLSSRTSVNYFKAQLAAQAGLAEAMALINENVSGFNYVSGSERQGDGVRTYVRRVDGSSGVWQFAGPPIYLDSGIGGESARIILTGSRAAAGLDQTATWKTLELESPRANESVRYAFFADEAGSKQNLAWWGGGGDRGVVTNTADIALQLPDLRGATVTPFPPAALSQLSALRSYEPFAFVLQDLNIQSVRAILGLPSVATMNLVSPGALQGSVTRYFFSSSSPSGAVTPQGRVKLNMAALTRYINTLTTEQGAGSARAQLVDQLLTPNPPDASNWGGGDLSWLANSGKYSNTEQKQIVANLIDYLDEDLIPTTDSQDAPTYMGVESKLFADGSLRGHPYANMVGLGSVFNWATGTGKLNSTRLLAFVGLANPWSATLLTGSYTPEIEIDIQGDVLGGELGAIASAYFKPALDEQLDVKPVTELAPGAGATFPDAADKNNYANFNSFFTGGNAQPATIAFRDIIYIVKKFRLKFTDDSGREGFVQILPVGTTVTMDPNTVTSPGGRSSQVYKFTRLSKEQKDLHLQGDPRLNFTAGTWTNSLSQNGTEVPPPTPQEEVDVTTGVGPDWDGAQGMTVGAEWYESSSRTNHFNRASREGMNSIGEFGYLWTGKPWQTLNLTKIASPASDDWNLLDYISAGRSFGGNEVATLPLNFLQGAPSTAAGLTAQGGFNINTRKFPTLAAVLGEAPELSADAATVLSQLPPSTQASPYGQIAEWTTSAATLFAAGTDTKFKREAAQRAMANLVVSQSRIFTIYSAGEYRQGTTVSRAYLESDVFVGVDPSTGDVRLQVLNQRLD